MPQPDSIHPMMQMLLAAGGGNTRMLSTVVAAAFAGVMLVIISRKLGLPSILLLLLGGFLLGPQVCGEYALVQTDSLGDGLSVIVSLAVGLILFEGGLTLNMDGYRSASTVIKRLLTVGVLVTWLGTAALVWLIAGVDFRFALLAGSLVIVTGPTVIAPLLKRINANARISSILHWEGVLIDPIGVFVAVLCFEWTTGMAAGDAVGNLLLRVLSGLAIGTAGGFGLSQLLKRNIVPEELLNVFALASAGLIFGAAEMIRSEAGLLSVTTAGFIVGLTRSVTVKQIRTFKEELTSLLIGALFVLLASRLTFQQFQTFGAMGFLSVGAVMLLVRPIGVLLCSVRTDVRPAERAFLSWVAPRGIVAGSVSSLFALTLERQGVDDASFVESFTYSVIIGTIVLQGSTAGWLVRRLGLQREQPNGWLIIGAHGLARKLAEFIHGKSQVPVVLIDSNTRAVKQARDLGLTSIMADARDVALHERQELRAVGNVLAFTDNEDLNARLCQIWAEIVGKANVFRCNPSGTDLLKKEDEQAPAGRVVWPRLPKPSLISGELRRGETITLQTSGEKVPAMHQVTALAKVVDGRVVLDPAVHDSKQTAKAPAADKTARATHAAGDDGTDDPTRSHTLFLRREADYLWRSIRPELIVTAQAANMKQVLAQMMDAVINVYPRLNRDEILNGLIEHEKVFPTALGHGVAAPHDYIRGLEERICAIARVPDGVDFQSPDGQAVRLVFMLLSPTGDPEGHLATLAEIARLLLDDTVRGALMDAKSPLRMLEIIRAAHS
jgi:NhaP-type Na+/H+ or K+/H+ antiporter/mannitol/fructose-specific phosphotransferase system IIA component (Ntr-type)